MLLFYLILLIKHINQIKASFPLTGGWFGQNIMWLDWIYCSHESSPDPILTMLDSLLFPWTWCSIQSCCTTLITSRRVKSTTTRHFLNGNQTYKTSPLTSEPVAIFKAALHNQSLCLFILNFRYLLSILSFREWGRIRQPAHSFRPPKLSRVYNFNRNINGDVSCRSVNWPLVTPRHKGFRQSKKTSNDQEPTQSDLTSCPQNQKGNN